MHSRFDKKHFDLWRTMIVCMLNAYLCRAVDGIPWKHSTEAFLEEGDSCKIKTGEPGICKRIDDCEPYYEGLRKKSIEYESLVRCTILNFSEVVCCPKAENSIEALPVVKTKGEQSDDESPSKAACNRYKKLNPAGLTNLILEGEPVSPGAFPHMAGLIFNETYGDVQLRCGASLISERYVLTAAHCVFNPESQPAVVRLGVVVWNAVVDDISPVDVAIENVTLHPLYRHPLHYHDIALLRLVRNVDFRPFIFPTCLHSDLRDISSATRLIVLGWGITNLGTRVTSDILLMTNVTTVPLESCNTTHTSINKIRPERDLLNGGQYCAFDPNYSKDACGADSGGPLQLGQKLPATLVGIVSYGQSCATATPSVYVRVAYYLKWIESIVWPS